MSINAEPMSLQIPDHEPQFEVSAYHDLFTLYAMLPGRVFRLLST